MLPKVVPLFIGLIFLSHFQHSLAGNVENEIIKKVVKSYGGEILTSAKSITITDYNKGPWPGQSENPGVPEIWRINEVLTIDLKNKRKSMLSWRVSRTSKDLDRFVFDGKKGRIDDILNQRFAEQEWLTYDSVGRSVSGRSDTMIAHDLILGKDVITTYDGEAMYRGVVHQKLKVKLRSSAEKILYIDKISGLISKVIRQHPRAGELIYVFSNHKQSNGVSFAQDMNFFVDGSLRLISVDRDIEINPSLEDIVFDLTPYEEWGEVFDTSVLSVNELADNVYHVGKDGSYTLFVDAGDYFIASGGEGTLKSNFQAVKTFSGIDKPLKYMIVTHHHIGSVNEAIELGASIVAASEHITTIKKMLPEGNENDVFTSVNDTIQLGNGAVEIYDIATAHSEHYLVVYVPRAKIVFGEDHFGTELKTAIPRVHKDMVTFGKAIEALGIDVERFIDAHGLRQLSITEFRGATNAYKNVICPKGYQICEKG
ncbi:MAG: MBL fold metallo-hydrolase [Colwellia sp.]|nr:MBL fold metallo-hydrolase [Colwellia sp.]